MEQLIHHKHLFFRFSRSSSAIRYHSCTVFSRKKQCRKSCLPLPSDITVVYCLVLP